MKLPRNRLAAGITIVGCIAAAALAGSCAESYRAGQDGTLAPVAGKEGSRTQKVKGEGGTFTDPKVCGECHSTHYAQWMGSMHHYAQASLTSEIVNDWLYKRTGKTVGLFCVQCHTPIGTTLGERADLSNKERSPLSMAGVSCDVCHSIDKAHGQVQAFIGLKPTPKVYGPIDEPEELSEPANQFHKAEQRDVFKSSQMCQHCHEVTVPNALRLQETYSEWKNSPWAKEGVTCQACHMSPTPGKPTPRPLGEIAQIAGVELPKRPISDHSFIGPDYHWTDQYPLRSRDGKEPDERTRKRNVNIQADLTKKRQELMRNSAKLHVTAPQSLRPGSSGTLSVRIENTFAGHHFPTGFPWRQAWLEVTFMDASGIPFFRSGDLDSEGDLRNQFSHDVNAGKVKKDTHLVNLQSQATVKGFRGNDVELIFPLAEEDAPAPTIFPAVGPQAVYNGADNARIIKRGIPARESRTYSYPIKTPDTATGAVSYRVRLLYRNFPAYYFDYFDRYQPELKGLLQRLKTQLEIYEVDAVAGKIAPP